MLLLSLSLSDNLVFVLLRLFVVFDLSIYLSIYLGLECDCCVGVAIHLLERYICIVRIVPSLYLGSLPHRDVFFLVVVDTSRRMDESPVSFLFSFQESFSYTYPLLRPLATN